MAKINKKIEISLKKEEKELLDKKIKSTRDAKISKRFMCIHHMNEGKNVKAIAELLLVTVETIRNWVIQYKEHGLESLSEFKYDGRRPSCLEEHKDEIEEYIKNNVISDINQVVNFINNTLNVDIKYHATRMFLKKVLWIYQETKGCSIQGNRKKCSRTICK